MKTRFNTYDIICMTTELQRLVGMRVNQVYDIDNRSYLIRLQRSEEKCVLLLESANRFHTTQFEWPKNVAPSGFTMKLRKHLKNKRLESLTQLGVDRVIDLQFGSGEAAYHIILELYDRGNIILTDYEWTILNVLRPHVEGDKVRFAVKEKYPLDRAKTDCKAPSEETLREILTNCKQGDNLKKVLNPKLEFGPAIIDHVLLENGLAGNMKVNKDNGFLVERDLGKLMEAMQQAYHMMENARKQICKGYIIQKKEERPNPEGEEKSFLLTNVEFHPMLYAQHRAQPHTEYETFDRAVDEFFSALEGQKIDLKTIQVEREALKKLENVRRDHSKRLESLTHAQAHDRRAAELIARNEPLVEAARNAVQTALATQMSWDDIQTMLKEAQLSNDPIASRIMQLKLNTNRISLLLKDPYAEADYDGDEEQEKLEPMLVDIDLSLTAYANARSYYDQKRSAAKKQQKTIESADKALKNAERKTKQTLKEAQTISNISKARKTYWFEKFFWFISSDNYLVIGGRDQQQNELLVKRYMRPKDVYVHAEVSGAASVLIKNPSGAPIPPRTLSEAGQAAVAYSVAWEAKVLTSAWWVHAHQVSKSAPTGEYLTTGSFMIRGKKNYLLPQHLQLGFSFLFRLEESCVERHRDERKVIGAEEAASDATSLADDQEIVVSDDDEPSEKDDIKSDKLDTIREEITNIVIEPDKEDKPVELEEDNDKCRRDEENKSEDDEQDKDNGKEIQSDSESDSEAGFPDTHIKVDHGTGEVVLQSKTRTMSEVSDRSEDVVSLPSLPKKGGKKPQKEPKEQKKEVKQKEGLKRGQRSKLKKIMEKYKDQDDEDREYMTNLLHAGNQSKKSKKAAKKEANKTSGKSKGNRGPKIPAPAPLILEADSDGETQETEVEQQTADVDTEMLCQLTGSPFPDDELLFAVPVVAPYSALNNYKFKVKLTPGTSKRGKAAKTAVQVFLKDRSCTPREKDLLKAVKEENFARNFPGKVKLSAPQLQKKLYNR